MRILLVEDEVKLNQSIKKGLEQKGYAVDSAYDGEQGELLAESENYDLIILDILMPKKDGLTVCRNLRSHGIHAPIIFLTAKDSLTDKITGLDSGADDYLVKPFEFTELLARIRALLRRPKTALPVVLSVKDLTLDMEKHSLKIKNREIKVTLRELHLLEYLLRNKNKVVTREELLEHVWDVNFDSFSNTVDVHIKNLRKKMKGEYAEKLETIRGLGYRFTE